MSAGNLFYDYRRVALTESRARTIVELAEAREAAGAAIKRLGAVLSERPLTAEEQVELDTAVRAAEHAMSGLGAQAWIIADLLRGK